MRQIAISNKKLRGIPRRLRSLEKWATGFEGLVRPQRGDERYFNWKIPVHPSLVQGRQTNTATKSFCIQQLIRAASYLSASPPPVTEIYYRVACLITWPWLHQSEVTIFYCREYYKSFLGEQNSLSPDRISSRLNLSLPSDFVEHGHDVTQPDDEVPVQWWCIGQEA